MRKKKRDKSNCSKTLNKYIFPSMKLYFFMIGRGSIYTLSIISKQSHFNLRWALFCKHGRYEFMEMFVMIGYRVSYHHHRPYIANTIYIRSKTRIQRQIYTHNLKLFKQKTVLFNGRPSSEGNIYSTVLSETIQTRFVKHVIPGKIRLSRISEKEKKGEKIPVHHRN